MAVETIDLLTFVIAVLSNDTELAAALPVHDGKPNIHSYSMPAEAPYSGVIVTPIPLDDNQHQGDARNSFSLVDIKLVIDGVPTARDFLAVKRIDALFRYVVARVQGEHQFSARRQKPINHREPNPVDAERFLINWGGTYKFWISQALS
jgi:hypothetical protein